MQIDKETVLNLLRERGDHPQAERAEQELPAQIDSDQHGALFEQFGLDPGDLVGKLMGGRDIPGL